MKLTFLFSAFAFLCLYASSQKITEFNYSFDYRYYDFDNLPIRYTPTQNVKKIFFEVEDSKTKKIKKYIREYNSENKLTKLFFIDKNNDTIPKLSNEYDNYGNNINNCLYNKKGAILSESKYIFLTKYKPLEFTKTNSSGKVKLYYTWTYNKDSTVTGSVRFKNGKSQIYRKWDYEYHEGTRKLKKSILSNGKGKVLNTWTYECNEEGTKLEKRKDETQVCMWNKTDDNYLIRVYQTFDEKGKVVKNVSKFTIDDTLLVEWARYDINDSLIYKTIYDKNNKQPIYSVSYNNGEITIEYKYEYINDLLSLQTVAYKGEIFSKSEYKYNDLGLLSEYRYYHKKGKLEKTINLSYEL